MSFTDNLRERVRKATVPCHACGVTAGSLRQVARETGLSPSTLTPAGPPASAATIRTGGAS